MAKKISKLKQFARQYRHKEFAGYLFIECPTVVFEMVRESRWSPPSDGITDLIIDLRNEGTMYSYGLVWSKADRCWYMVSHMWLATLPIWGPDDMRRYMTDVLTVMLSKAYTPDVVVEEKPAELFVPQNLEEDAAITAELRGKPVPLVQRLKEEVAEEDFMSKVGISRQTYLAMAATSDILELPFVNGELEIVQLTKALWNKYNLGMMAIYSCLKDYYIIIQAEKDNGGKDHVYLADNMQAEGWGYTRHYQDTNRDYPVFTIKGTLSVLLILHEAGLLPVQVIPSLPQ